jgi:predicted MFS family arabinose efflux permease
MAPQEKPGPGSLASDGCGRWAILALLFFCRTSLGFQFQTMGSAAPGVTAEIGLSLTEIGTLIGLFMLPGVFLSIPSGYAARYMTDRGLLALGLLVMGLGGATAAIASGFGMLALGRILCGIGFVIGTIYFAKMVADWFAGRELATAMSILVVTWPLGIAIGQVTHDWLMTQFHWRLPFAIASAYCVTAALALWLGYRAPAGMATPRNAAAPMGLPARELWLTLLAASVWAFFNAGYLVFLSFAPKALQDSGFAAHQAIPMVSAASALMMISIPLSGMIADRTGRPDAVLYLCSAVAVVCLLALPYAPFAILACLLFGLIGMGPAGVIMALTGQAMSPARRAFGMGVFSTIYYAITAPAPALAGWLVDRSGAPQDALILAAVLFALTMLANLAFRVAVRQLR